VLLKSGAISPDKLVDPRGSLTPMNMPAADADASAWERELAAHCDFYYVMGGATSQIEKDLIVVYDKGGLDKKKVVDFEKALHGYMLSAQAALVDRINASGDYNAEIEQGLHAALKDFKANNTW